LAKSRGPCDCPGTRDTKPAGIKLRDGRNRTKTQTDHAAGRRPTHRPTASGDGPRGWSARWVTYKTRRTRRVCVDGDGRRGAPALASEVGPVFTGWGSASSTCARLSGG